MSSEVTLHSVYRSALQCKTLENFLNHNEFFIELYDKNIRRDIQEVQRINDQLFYIKEKVEREYLLIWSELSQLYSHMGYPVKVMKQHGYFSYVEAAPGSASLSILFYESDEYKQNGYENELRWQRSMILNEFYWLLKHKPNHVDFVEKFAHIVENEGNTKIELKKDFLPVYEELKKMNVNEKELGILQNKAWDVDLDELTNDTYSRRGIKERSLKRLKEDMTKLYEAYVHYKRVRHKIKKISSVAKVSKVQENVSEQSASPDMTGR